MIFLHKHQCTIDLTNNTLQIEGKTVDCCLKIKLLSLFRIKLTETVTIPSISEMIVGGYFSNPDKDILPKCALLEGSDKLLENKQVLVARSLVNLRTDIIPVRVLNPHDQPRQLFKETVLGSCEIVQQVETDVQNCSKLNQMNTDTETSSIPEHFQILLAKCQPFVVSKMLDTGIITPSCSPWSSPIVFVTKKDGSCRFCIDYRKLNSVTIKDSYSLPNPNNCLQPLHGSKWFSTLDLASG